MKENTGSCSCEQVQFKLSSEVLTTVNCHCHMCRENNGGAFSTYAVLPLSSLEFTKGSDIIREYELGSAKKMFCSECGTPIYNTNSKYPSACMIYLGVLKNHEELVPVVNSWCDSQLPWVNNLPEIQNLAEDVPSK